MKKAENGRSSDKIVKEKEKSAVFVDECAKPSARVNFTITKNEQREEEVVIFGGEYFNGENTYVYQDVYRHFPRAALATQHVGPSAGKRGWCDSGSAANWLWARAWTAGVPSRIWASVQIQPIEEHLAEHSEPKHATSSICPPGMPLRQLCKF